MASNKKRKAPRPGRLLHIILLVLIVLIIFEGRLLAGILSKGGLQERLHTQLNELFAGSESETQTETETGTESAEKKTGSGSGQAGLVGFGADPYETESETGIRILYGDESETEAQNQETETEITSSALVPEQSVKAEDSYFSDATFVGDSRMEGFRINSGLTEGTFVTAVGMNTENFFDTAMIATSYGDTLTPYQALIGTESKKFYVMLGTNELGTYDWNEFKDHYSQILKEIQILAPSSIIYVTGVPYVEETKVETDTSYVTNENVDKLNSVLISICEEGGYHYLNLNEVLSNGHRSLIKGASEDGVHLYADYCKVWLEYLRTHYVSETGTASSAETEEASGEQTETGNESETESET